MNCVILSTAFVLCGCLNHPSDFKYGLSSPEQEPSNISLVQEGNFEDPTEQNNVRPPVVEVPNMDDLTIPEELTPDVPQSDGDLEIIEGGDGFCPDGVCPSAPSQGFNSLGQNIQVIRSNRLNRFRNVAQNFRGRVQAMRSNIGSRIRSRRATRVQRVAIFPRVQRAIRTRRVALVSRRWGR